MHVEWQGHVRLHCRAAARSSSAVGRIVGDANLVAARRAHFLRWQQEAPLRTIDIPVDSAEDARAVEYLLHYFYTGKLPLEPAR
jgi:hypothetical protein